MTSSPRHRCSSSACAFAPPSKHAVATSSSSAAPPSRGRRALLLGLLCVGGVAFLGGSAAPRVAFAGEGLSGTWVLAMSDAERGAHAAAIDAAAETFSRLIRGIARGRIARAAIVPERYVIADKGDRIAMALDAGPSRETDTAGTSVTFAMTERGEDVTLSRTRDGASLTSRATTGAGSLESHFVRDGSHLSVTFTLRSERLDQPVVYTLSYVPSMNP